MPSRYRWVGKTVTLNYSGGELRLQSSYNYYSEGNWLCPNCVGNTLINNGTINLSGIGTRVIDGNVVNNGTFKTTNTTAVYTGDFTNNGAYISDPATQYFKNLTITEDGYLIGQRGDKFYIGGDFINHSIMNMDWNTKQAYLGFMTGSDNLHDFYLTGVDYGAMMNGFADNFSWGTLDISENILHLYDGDAVAGAALYLRNILGLEISDDLITNLFGYYGLNVYYMANLKENDYLGGLVYNLSGGGYLIPIPSPEPATMLLLGLGLIGLAGVRRKIQK